MTIQGSLLLILALLGLAGLGICLKVADFVRCKPRATNMMLFGWAAAVLWGYTFFYQVMGKGATLFPPFTGKAVVIAVVCGILSSIAILTFAIGIRYGRISTSWLVINLSAGLPAILSLIVYQEWKTKMGWQLPVGLMLTVISILLLWQDKKIEIKQGQESTPQAPLEKK